MVQSVEERRERDRLLKQAIPIEARRAYNAKWRETVSEEWREAKRVYNRERLQRIVEADPDYYRKRRNADLERARAQDRRRYERDKPKRIAIVKVAGLRRRARKLACKTFRVSEADWMALVRRYDHRCAYCSTKGKLCKEHIIPLARGGDHSIGNLLPVCDTCNKSKGPKLLVEWRRAA